MNSHECENGEKTFNRLHDRYYLVIEGFLSCRRENREHDAFEVRDLDIERLRDVLKLFEEREDELLEMIREHGDPQLARDFQGQTGISAQCLPQSLLRRHRAPPSVPTIEVRFDRSYSRVNAAESLRHFIQESLLGAAKSRPRQRQISEDRAAPQSENCRPFSHL